MKPIRIFLLLLSVIAQVGYGQWIVYTPYNTKGIEGTMISSGLVANDDKLWFGTDQGVACFDPENATWMNYNTGNSLTNNFIYQVFQDKEGSIWAATNGGGISRYANYAWTNYTMHDGLSYDVVRAVSQSPDGTIWIGTYGHGICTYKTGTGFHKITTAAIANSYVLSILAVSDDLILIGTLNEGLMVLENDTIRSLQNANELSGKKVFAIFSDHNNKIWLGTDQGAQQFNPSTRTVLSCPDSLKGKIIYSVCENQAHELVFTSNNKIYTLSSGSWSSFVPDKLSGTSSFYSAFYDKEGNGWFGSSNQGLFKKTGNTWYNYYNSSGLDGTYNLTDMCEDKNKNLWFCAYQNIYRFDGQNWNNMAKKAGLINDYFGKMITDQKGNIWITSSYKGLYKYDGNTFTTYSRDIYFDYGYVENVALGPDGSIWAGTSANGIYRYNGTTWTRFTTEQGLASDNINAMAFFKDGKLAVVSYNSQISIYDGKSWKVDNSLNGMYYNSAMTIDSANNIWLATYNGIIRHKNLETEEYFVGDPYSPYGQNYVTFVSVDKNGLLWAGIYNTGLLKYDGTNWITYSAATGLSSNYLRDILFDSQGRTWVLADNGINMSAFFTGIDESGSFSPEKILVYPNPFSASFDIQYSSNTEGFADINIYTTDGRLVKQYPKKKVDMGENTFHFETDNWPDGLLFCKIIVAGSSKNIKLLKVSNN